MASSHTKQARICGKFCVAGGPGNVSCTNNSLSPGISMHTFPKDEIIRRKWTKFVQKHRPAFRPSKTSVICSVHFSQSCFSRRLDLLDSAMDVKDISSSRRLEKGSVPTIDTAITQASKKELSSRDKRKIIKKAIDDQRPNSEPSILCETEEHDEQDNHNQPLDVSPGESTIKPNCESCQRKSDTIRKLQKTNSYLRGRVRQLSDHYESLDETEDSDKIPDIDNKRQEHVYTDSTVSTETESDNDTNIDPDWQANEFEDANDNIPEVESNISVKPGIPSYQEPAFIVFYSKLLLIFSLFCFNCKTESPKPVVKKNGTMVKVIQTCSHCSGYTWQSQPLVLGKCPAGNVLLSFASLMAGASISKILLFCRHMGLCAISIRTYFVHQKNLIFPSILHYWEVYRSRLLSSLKPSDTVWGGDGRFDSMGHSAKYGAYTMFSPSLMKVVHFELLQANEAGSSQAMELEGAKRCFDFLLAAGVKILVFISDRHRGIAKWLREKHPSTNHFYDIWHVCKSITKKLLKASKEKGCGLIKEWMKAIRRHLYWCATSTKQGFHAMILAKWKSFMEHVSNKHDHHPDKLFPKCAHENNLPRRKWIKIGTKTYEKLNSILMNKRILSDIKQLSSEAQTSCLECFHATLNHWHPKMLCFSWLGTYCRHILASLHFNENVHRETKRAKDGKIYYHVTWPKYKLGEEVVKEVTVPHTYGYVEEIRNVLFTLSPADRKEMLAKYVDKVPQPLNRQFKDRLSKEEAVNKRHERNQLRTQLFPEAAKQDELQLSTCNTATTASQPQPKRKAPCCRTCWKAMLGHCKADCVPCCKNCLQPILGHSETGCVQL